MLQTDADRLESLKALDGEIVLVQGGQNFWAIFDNEFALQEFAAGGLEDRAPMLQCRTSDVEALKIGKDTALRIRGNPFTVRRHEPDGTGMSRLILNS